MLEGSTIGPYSIPRYWHRSVVPWSFASYISSCYTIMLWCLIGLYCRYNFRHNNPICFWTTPTLCSFRIHARDALCIGYRLIIKGYLIIYNSSLSLSHSLSLSLSHSLSYHINRSLSLYQHKQYLLRMSFVYVFAQCTLYTMFRKTV